MVFFIRRATTRRGATIRACGLPQRDWWRRISSLTVNIAALFFVNSAVAQDTWHEYLVTIDETLEILTVEASFRHPIDNLSAKFHDAGEFLLDARNCLNGERIQTRGRRMILPLRGLSCLKYSVDLKRVAMEHRNSDLLLAGNIIASPVYWLWRPPLRGSEAIRIEFRLPPGVQVSVPWQSLSDSQPVYLLSDSPQSAYAPAVFGNFDRRLIHVPGAVLSLSILRSTHTMDNDSIASWIEAAAFDASLVYGRFPNPSAQIVIIAVGDENKNSRSAVPFGRVVRDGGESVELFVDQTQPLAALLADWTATHEFSHLLLPYLDRRQRWISEGFSQYYQNVLLTRSGAYDELYAWQKLHDGYQRGRLARPELSPAEAASGNDRGGLMKVYWSGAALALIADVTLRERSNGTESLDTVLEKLQACCLPARRVWSGREFLEKLDSLLLNSANNEPVFMPLYRRHADAAGFPDVSGYLARLGVAVSDGVVRLRSDAPLTSVRLSIMQADAVATSRRLQLAGN